MLPLQRSRYASLKRGENYKNEGRGYGHLYMLGLISWGILESHLLVVSCHDYIFLAGSGLHCVHELVLTRLGWLAFSSSFVLSLT
jgi:hypothetical protein